MKNNKTILFTGFYWKIAAIFLAGLIVFASIAVYISVRAASNYSIEVNQKLNKDLASNMLDAIKPDFRSGIVNQEALADIMHSMMVINPSVEVYILDPEGKILSYVAPEKVVKLEEVDLGPIQRFLKDKGRNIVYGDDPRNPGEQKIFSAAEVREDGHLTGYIYIVLASQEYISASHMVLGSYILGLSIKSIVGILFITALIGLVAIWYFTKKLNHIVKGIREFKMGNLEARIPIKKNDEFDKIGLVFNEMAATIEQNIKELQGIDELRKELISNVSHDLRTPVASIQGYAETLLLKAGKIDTSRQQKFAEVIYKSSEKLKLLVDELFELSKLESDQVKLNTESFSIVELVSDVANKYRIISRKRGISINTFITKDIPAVEADISLIDRVLQNLIDNAVKFCREGDYINLEIRLSTPERVKVSIADSGIGIAKKDLPHIFERYFTSRTHAESTGLGLAIVKKIIDLHHSEINVESRAGKGTTFTFDLPVSQVA
ncbi:MAG: HAMP domain-containing sensor histidine kinase [Bacteroidales bacterium]|jgi:signal transduction histidine kinase